MHLAQLAPGMRLRGIVPGEVVRVLAVTHLGEMADWLSQTRDKRSAELDKRQQLVQQRLGLEMNRLAGEAMAAQEREAAGGQVRESSQSLANKASDLEQRLAARLRRFERQQAMGLKPPRVVSAALVLPLAMAEADLPFGRAHPGVFHRRSRTARSRCGARSRTPPGPKPDRAGSQQQGIRHPQ